MPDVGSSFQDSQGSGQQKSDREMTVCEMSSFAEAAERRLRQAYNEYLRAQTDVARARGQRSAAATPLPLTPPPSFGSLYCEATKDLFGVKEAHAAQAPPPSQGPPAPPSVQPVAPIVPTAPVATDPGASDLAEAQSRSADALQQVVSNQKDRNTYLVEIHKKFSLAVACFVFVLVGAPIALRFPGGGVGLTIGVSFAIFALYYVGLISGESLANNAIVPPGLAMWLANILMVLVGLYLTARMGREAGTNRGGGAIADLLARFEHRRGTRGAR